MTGRFVSTASRKNLAAVCRPPPGVPPPLLPSVPPFSLVGSVTMEMRPLYGQQRRDILIHLDWTGGSEPRRWALAGCLLLAVNRPPVGHRRPPQHSPPPGSCWVNDKTTVKWRTLCCDRQVTLQLNLKLASMLFLRDQPDILLKLLFLLKLLLLIFRLLLLMKLLLIHLYPETSHHHPEDPPHLEVSSQPETLSH